MRSRFRTRILQAGIASLLYGQVLCFSSRAQSDAESDSEHWLVGTEWALEREDGYRCKLIIGDSIKHSNDGRVFDYSFTTPHSIEYQSLKRKISLTFDKDRKAGQYLDETGDTGVISRVEPAEKPGKEMREDDGSGKGTAVRPNASNKLWTNNDGTTIEADFICQYRGNLTIRTEDGVEHTIPVTNLDADSREKARQLAVSGFAPWTASDIKEVWKNSLPPLPRTLAPDFHQVKKANAKRLEKIEAGVYDDLAIEQALRANIDELVALQQADLALVYQKSLATHLNAVRVKKQGRAEQIRAFSAELEKLHREVSAAMNMHYMSVFKK